MKKIPVIVVEGKTDVDRLSRLTNSILVSTNGSDVPRETLDYIKTLSKDHDIIILTDPDYPGLRIREKVAKEVPGAYHAYVDRNKSSNGKKLGVAECEEEEILRALKDAIQYSFEKELYLFSSKDLYKLHLTGYEESSKLRIKVFDHFHLGYGNAKVLAKRLSEVGITYQEVEDYIKEELLNENIK